jgi:hypothetical protein
MMFRIGIAGCVVTEGMARDGRMQKPPMAYAYYAGLQQADPGGYHCLSAHGAAAAMKPSQTAGSACVREAVFL